MERARLQGGSRAVMAGLLVILEAVGIAALLFTLQTQAIFLYITLQALSGVIILCLMGGAEDNAYRTAWMGCVLILGIAGVGLYMLFGRRKTSHLARLSCENMERAQELLYGRGDVPDLCGEKAVRYLHARGFPLYRTEDCRYFPLGEDFFEALFDDIARARRSVDLEFFIFSSGRILEKLLKICEQAHERGVVIRLLIDDAGTMMERSATLRSRLTEAGIQWRIFNPILRHAPLLTLNFRDHRKIAVIDGNVAYTGGINLADEYANVREKHGHWKDTGIRLTGQAVGSMSAFFQALWAAAGGQRLGTVPELLPEPSKMGQAGWVQPYQSGPQGARRNASLALYRLLIAGARQSVWITTPYLLLDESLEGELCTAAQSGVDVRIILPGVPDHKLVELAGEAHFPALLRSGVLIYRYTPGFVHAKMCLCDGNIASIGTVNFDFRSLYLHFEDGVVLIQTQCIRDIRADLEDLMAKCEQITLETALNVPAVRRIGRMIVHALSPLM